MNTNGKTQSILSDAVKDYSAWEIIRRLMLYIKPYKKMALAALALSIASSALLVIRPYFIKVVIDTYITRGNLNGLTVFMVMFIAVYILRLFTDYLLNMVTGVIGQKVMHDLRMAIFSHILSMEMSFFDHNKVGRLMTRTTDDVATLNELYTSGAVSMINNSGILVGIVVVMVLMDWKLTLVTLAVSPLIYFAAYIFSKKIRTIYRNIRKNTARLNAFLQESIQGIRIIKQMMRAGWARDKFALHSDELMKYKIENVFQYGLFFPVMEFFSVVAVVFILVHAGHRIYYGTLQLGVMVAFIRLVDMFFWPVREMAENFNVMLSAMSSSERIFTLLDTKSLITDPPSPVPTLDGTEIVFDHVWFAYEGEEWVLRDVSFRVASGERVAFVGPTGAGKTTIISLLLRFYDVTRGRIYVGGKDIREIGRAHV
jgi:ATP-binding cassette subfamily B protein